MANITLDSSMTREDLTLELIAERLTSIDRAMTIQFGTLNEKVDSIKDAPVRLSRIETVQADNLRRIEALENDRKGDREWKRVSLPTLLIAVLMLFVGIVPVIQALSH